METDQTHRAEAGKERRGRTFEGKLPGAYSPSDLDLGGLTPTVPSHPVSSSLSDAAGGVLSTLQLGKLRLERVRPPSR